MLDLTGVAQPRPSSVETIAGRFAAWKRAQASFRTRARSLSSLMLLTVGLRETCPKNVPPNHVERPMSCATFPTLEGFYFDPPYPMVSVTGLPRRALRRLRHGLGNSLGATPTARNATRR